MPSAFCSCAPPPSVVQTPALHYQTCWMPNHFNCGCGKEWLSSITEQQCTGHSKLWISTWWNHRLHGHWRHNSRLDILMFTGRRRPRCLAPPANPKRRLCSAGMDYRLVCSRGCGLKKRMRTSNRPASHTYAPVPGFSGVIQIRWRSYGWWINTGQAWRDNATVCCCCGAERWKLQDI